MTPSTPSTSDAVSRIDPSSRILVIDRDDLADRVRQAADGAKVAVVATYLAAMGEVTRQPVDAIVGPLDAMSGLIESTAHGLRRLAPDAMLIVAAEPGDEVDAAAALDAGFDHCLRLPLDTEQLERVLAGIGQPVGVHREEDPDSVATSDDVAEPGSQPVEDAKLGDTDLVEAVLLGVDALQQTALRIIHARSGLADVDYLAKCDPKPRGHAVAVLRYHRLDLGCLHAPPPVREEQLKPWADWFAHWLTLAQQHDQLKHLAMRDELTGAWNRRYFNRFLTRILDRAAQDRSQVTLMVFDIDDFKVYNDRYGHAAGDEILREAAKLMHAVVREHDVVARIGGDEFAVIFWDAEGPRKPNSTHPQDVAKAAHRFQQAICAHQFPKLLDDAPGTLTISGGLASFPWDGTTPDQLLARADEMALKSKRQGKNAITFGPGALRDTEAIGGDGL